MIKIKFVLPEGLERLSQIPISMRNRLFEAMEEGAELLKKTVKRKYMSGPYPVKLSSDTGDLKDSIYTRVVPGHVSRNTIGRIEFGSYLWYSQIHEQKGVFGTFKTIRSNSDKGMTFFWKRKNIWVHGAKKVRIPSRPFLGPTVVDCEPAITMLLQKAVLGCLKDMG